jgi:hypothetical protein
MHKAGRISPRLSSFPSILIISLNPSIEPCLPNTAYHLLETLSTGIMDGLSAAASGIAVVSLALQLVGSVRDIRRFLHDMSEASEELKRMMDLLEQLEIILEQVGLLVQRQRGNGRLEETGVMTSVSRAIVTCEKKLTLLEGVVEATQKASANSRVAKTLGSFKLACHKKDIRSFEQQLSEAVNLLSLTMMANLT